MGNNQIKDIKEPKQLSHIIDFIATNYILTSNFNDLVNLTDENYCNDLIVLTSKVLENNLDYKTIEYLAQKTKKGEIINEMVEDKMIFFNKNKLTDLKIHNNVKKKRICFGIAKFYIKIAHLYSAIMTTINPEYIYKDDMGQKIRVNLFDKNNIPRSKIDKIIIEKRNICTERIKSLNKYNIDISNNNDLYNINPGFCNMNTNIDGSIKSLINEPGIFELQQLYYDNYDYSEGRFIGMTEKMKEIYKKDLQKFYKFYTGNNELPDNINKFSDIKLRDFSNYPICKNIDFNNIKGSIKDKLFYNYSMHIKNMIQKAKENQNKLLTVIDKIFSFSINPITNKRMVTINHSLNEKKLQDIIIETKELIINLYINCQEDFLKGLQLFEAIVQKQIFDTSKLQIRNLEDNMQEKIASK